MQSELQQQPQAKPGEIVVIITRQDGTCAECGESLGAGNFIRVESGANGERVILCMDCADLSHLSFLPSGDAAITRRASKYSTLRAVVVRWAKARKRYERQGILVEHQAIDEAEQECLADAEVRRRRQERAAVVRQQQDQEFVAAFAAAVARQYPNCPSDAAQAITLHACEKYSGRVGRSAAAKEFAHDAIRLAVTAHIRHVHTDYDAALSRHGDRRQARERVWGKVQEVLEMWSRPRAS
jgi:hypothetical protein